MDVSEEDTTELEHLATYLSQFMRNEDVQLPFLGEEVKTLVAHPARVLDLTLYTSITEPQKTALWQTLGKFCRRVYHVHPSRDWVRGARSETQQQHQKPAPERPSKFLGAVLSPDELGLARYWETAMRTIEDTIGAGAPTARLPAGSVVKGYRLITCLEGVECAAHSPQSLRAFLKQVEDHLLPGGSFVALIPKKPLERRERVLDKQVAAIYPWRYPCSANDLRLARTENLTEVAIARPSSLTGSYKDTDHLVVHFVKKLSFTLPAVARHVFEPLSPIRFPTVPPRPLVGPRTLPPRPLVGPPAVPPRPQAAISTPAPSSGNSSETSWQGLSLGGGMDGGESKVVPLGGKSQIVGVKRRREDTDEEQASKVQKTSPVIDALCKFKTEVLKRAMNKAGERKYNVLDLFAGRGDGLELYNEVEVVTMVDNNQEDTAFIINKAAELGCLDRVTVVTQDPLDFDMKENTYDLISCHLALGRLWSEAAQATTPAFMERIYKALKPGGVFVCTLPDARRVMARAPVSNSVYSVKVDNLQHAIEQIAAPNNPRAAYFGHSFTLKVEENTQPQQFLVVPEALDAALIGTEPNQRQIERLEHEDLAELAPVRDLLTPFETQAFGLYTYYIYKKSSSVSS